MVESETFVSFMLLHKKPFPPIKIEFIEKEKRIKLSKSKRKCKSDSSAEYLVVGCL